MNQWATRHADALSAHLEPGESLLGAERVILAGNRRRPPHGLPRSGFVLAVTDRRVLVIKASTWLARPLELIASWRLDEGVVLSAASAFVWNRLHLVLPDRTVVKLRPYGTASISHLAA